MNVRFFFAVILVVCLGSAAYWVSTRPRPVEEARTLEVYDVSAFGDEDLALIDTWLKEQVSLAQYPSLSVAIVRKGEVVSTDAFGYEDVKEGKKATPKTPYHVASVTKAFTASLAMILHDRGVVNLDYPVVQYLPEGVSLSVTPERGATITLRQLASHTSGLPRKVPGPVQSVEGRYQLEPERLYEHLGKVTLEFAPGTGERYSNLGFGLLGHALERAAGKPFDQLLQEALCVPLKLEETAIHVDPELQVATGYATRSRIPKTHSYQKRLASSGGLVTSVEDLTRFLSAHMEPGLFSRRMLAQLHAATRLKNGSVVSRGLGWSLRANGTAGLVLSKNGGRSNSSAWIGFVPEHGIGVAVITNCGEPDVDSIGRWLLERAIPGGLKLVTEHGFAKVAPYTGVRWEDDQPIVQVEGRWSPLVSINEISIERIMSFAQREYGAKARMRLGEDLVELLTTMGYQPGWKVTLGLKMENGTVEELQVRMTESNRALVQESSKKQP